MGGDVLPFLTCWNLPPSLPLRIQGKQIALNQPLSMNQQAAPGQPMPNVVPVHTVDNSNAATMGLVFGIFSLIFAFFTSLAASFTSSSSNLSESF